MNLTRSIAALISAALLMLFAMNRSVVAAPPDDLVKIKLLADVANIVPGAPFTLGMQFKMAPGWHIYWLNPGDSGEATRVNFTLPPGFTVSELKFPVPERIVLPGDIVSYGYENEVTLVATVTPPKDLEPGQTIEISAKADWLVCKEICLPGDGQASLNLPVTQKSEPANSELFDALWFPTPGDNASGSGASAEPLDLSSGQGETEIRVNIDGNRHLELFPYPMDDVTLIIGRARVVPKFNLVPIKASVLPGQAVSAKKFHVLVVSRVEGHRFAYDVPITIVTGGASAPSSTGNK
ncbi:hypothetical protein BH09PLA1_BH09PLA1_22240 [soil metagenome]